VELSNTGHIGIPNINDLAGKTYLRISHQTL